MWWWSLHHAARTWPWTQLAAPPLTPRSNAQVLWSGTRLIVIGGTNQVVIGGHTDSSKSLLSGATFDPQANRWSPLPALPKYVVAKGTSEEPAGVIAAWTLGRLSVWVTCHIVQVCGNGCSEVRRGSRPWSGARAHPRGSAPRSPYPCVYLRRNGDIDGEIHRGIGGSAVRPPWSRAHLLERASLSAWSFNTKTDSWSPIPTDSVVGDPQSFAGQDGALWPSVLT